MLKHLDGCVLQPMPAKPGIPQILQLKLTPEMLEQLLHSKGTDTTISFDKEMEIRIGDNRHGFSMTPESSKVDVYRRRKHSSVDRLEQIGSVCQKIVVRRQLGNNISEKLKSRQAEEAAAKHERSVQTLEFDPKLKRSKTGALSRASTPLPVRPDSPSRKSPFLQARKSPLLVASSPKTQAVSLRTRVVQSLALGAVTEQDLALKLKVPSDAISQVLADVGRQSGNQWVLNDEQYQGLKVWDWKGYTSAERSAVISRASEAYDRLGLQNADPLRVRLIHPDKRKPEERQDTSPLSLNPPVSVQSTSQEVNVTADRPRVSDSQPSTSERKPSARGILTTGNLSGEKKRKLETNTSPPKQSKLRNTIDSVSKSQDTSTANLSSQKRQSRSSLPQPEPASLTQPTSSPQTTNRRQGVIHKEPLASHKKSQASMDRTGRDDAKVDIVKKPVSVPAAKSNKQTSVSPRKTSESIERSQTAYADSAKLAPFDRSPVSVDESFDDRTASLTSSSTVNTDRTVASASSVSTAPTSVSSPPPPTKPRSKFLTTKKDVQKSLTFTKLGPPGKSDNATRTQAQESKQATQSGALPSAITGSQQQADSQTLRTRKRKAEDEKDVEEPSRKRMQSIDLQNMARDYKRLYPEYKDLHAEVASKVGDSSLLTKFMEMHNQMSLWKQTLYAAEKDYN